MISSKFNYPHLDLPTGQEVRAFRAIEKVLRNDPRFGVVTKTWAVWDGSTVDTMEPAFDWCPFCKISPFPTESHWITESQHEAPLALRIQLAVCGTRFEEIGNYWAAMRAAIFPQDPASRDAVMAITQAATINRPTITLMGYGAISAENEAARMMVADGTFSCHILINT